MVVDRAGNTLRQAALIQPGAKFSSRQDAIGRTDKDDYYKFKFARSSGLQLSLSGLKADVDLALLNSKGRVLQKSSQRGTRDEFLIQDNLKAGTYYLRVYQRSSNTSYKLSFATSPVGHKEPSPLTAADTGIGDNGAFDYLGGSDDGSIIDLMVVYTAKARQAEGGISAINAAINRAVNEVNEGYANSGVIPRIRLVHTSEVNYAETRNSQLDLSRLKNPSDGYMDEVHTLRNQYGADIVSLFAENLDPGVGGLAYVMQNVSQYFESSAFNVVQTFSAKYGFALGHEIGHNLGAAHDRDNAKAPGAYSYSYGYITPTKIGDVMSYAPKRKNYYSSPNIVVEGQPLGRTNSEDVVQTFNNVRLTAANWRKSVIAVNTTPSITLSASDAIAAEVPAGQLLNPGQFTLTRTGSTTSPLTVNYVVSGAATNGIDYSVLGGAVTFAAGSQTAAIAVNPIHDTTAEGNETVVLRLTPSTNYTFGTSSSAIVTIEDDNRPTITIGATDSTAAEATSGQTPNTGQFTLNRTGSLDSALTVQYTLSGSAINGVDYAALSSTATFGVGSSTTTVFVSPIDDQTIENAETVTAGLAAGTGYSLGAGSSATVTIVDNDFALTRESFSSTGQQANGPLGFVQHAISANGRYVAFTSAASNLVPNDTNGAVDVFVRDRYTGQTQRVSVSSSGTQSNSALSNNVSNITGISMSADGRYISFVSDASNLVAGDTNGKQDIFVHDRLAGQTTRVNISSSGVQANDDFGNPPSAPSISADGRYVAFTSKASNLVAGDTNGWDDVFVHDRQTGQTTRISVNSTGVQGDLWSKNASISADGRYVTFESLSSNLVPGDTNNTEDIFVHDRQTGQTTRVNVSSTGAESSPNQRNSGPSISADGRYVAFTSAASNLVAGDTNGIQDIFVHDRQAGQTTRVSITSQGSQVNAGSGNPSISADGRYVTFYSVTTALIGLPQSAGFQYIYVHDRLTGKTDMVSRAADSSIPQNHADVYPAISANGQYVVFGFQGQDTLIPGDTSTDSDLYVRTLWW